MMLAGGSDYGRAGRVGIGTPQANPTVETEVAILLPPNVSMAVTRLTSQAPRPADRLREYLLRLPDYLAAYDNFRPDLFGFGCTASSYLLGADEAGRVLADCERRFGYPIITAADAIAWTLSRIGARRIAIVTPYPEGLAKAAFDYWQARGFDPVEAGRAGSLAVDADTRGIYELGSVDAARALAGIDIASVDAILITGTGMPSLPLIAAAPVAVPILSSNLCLVATMAHQLGLGDLLDPTSSSGRAWRDRCRAAISPPFGSDA